MEDQHFLDQDNLNIENERPSFLTVLCIITFVFSGFLLISTLYGLVTYDELAQQEAFELTIVSMEELGENLPGMDENIRDLEIFNKEQMDNNVTLQAMSILSILLSLFGAFLMYQLKKVGFHLYLASKVVGLIPLLIFTLSTAVFWAYGIFLVFTIAFVIMYSRNLKFMK
ncbi:hypothetical protein N9P38_01090 [Flavobacteriales bacterium]|nr:hypothetical protein [Flavobacteriales bacterium]